jgi:hypothetical protein
MKRYKRNLLLFISFIFIFTMLFIRSTKAEDINTNVYRYEWKDDSLVSGSNQIGKTFYVPENMNCYNFIISLKIKQSPTLIKDISSILILINNTKVYSIIMDKIDANGIVTVKVPDYLIYKGGNSIVVKVFLKSTAEKCEINNDVNWVVVEKTSSFSFNYSRTDSADISDIFDDTYYFNGSKGEVNITLPDDLTGSNYSQISSISALLGFMHKNKETDVSIRNFKFSELNSVNKETVVIGTIDQIKAFNKDLLKDEEWRNAEESGYIAIRKIGMKNHFIVIVSNEAQLETLCRILAHKSSLSQIKGKDYVLNKDKIVNESEFNINPSLNSLGYENSSQAGNGTKEFSYYFTIPSKKTLTIDNKLTFVYNYSSLIDYDNGYLTVAINGENLISKKFVKDKLQDKIEVTIPEKYFDYTGFNISLKFNLKLEVEKCTDQSYEDVWVTIDSINSNFKLELKDRTKYSLFNSQGLLQNSNGYVDGNIEVDSFNNLLIDSICQISSYLGRVSQGVNKLYINESKDNKTPSGAIFSLTASPIIKTVNDNLRIPISDNGEFVSKDLFTQNTPSLGAIEVTLNGDKLVITASDKDQLNNTIQKYSAVTSSKDTVILKDGKIIDYFGEVKVPTDKKLGAIKTNYEIILALVVLLGASISIFILYYIKVKK